MDLWLTSLAKLRREVYAASAVLLLALIVSCSNSPASPKSFEVGDDDTQRVVLDEKGLMMTRVEDGVRDFLLLRADSITMTRSTELNADGKGLDEPLPPNPFVSITPGSFTLQTVEQGKMIKYAIVDGKLTIEAASSMDDDPLKVISVEIELKPQLTLVVTRPDGRKQKVSLEDG